MSRDKGNRAAKWFAAYLRTRWYPHAEALPNGRPGADIENTPPVAFEVKTGAEWRSAWLRQVAKYPGDWKVVIYFPPGCGEAQVARGQFIVPVEVGMMLLEQAGYTGVPPGLEPAQIYEAQKAFAEAMRERLGVAHGIADARSIDDRHVTGPTHTPRQ